MKFKKLVIALCALTIGLVTLTLSAGVLLAENSEEQKAPWNIDGEWYIEGVGAARKGIIDLELHLTGNILVKTSPDLLIIPLNELRATSPDLVDFVVPDRVNPETNVVSLDYYWLTGGTIKLNLYVTDLELRAWKDTYQDDFTYQVPLPVLYPTMNNPFELPPIPIKDENIWFKITLNDTNSGLIDIAGEPNIGGWRVEIDSESAIWRAETSKPNYDESKEGGCNSGFSLSGALMLVALAYFAKS